MSISKLVQMRITNFGCIGPEGVEISLDNIVCLVGPNNVGKSTVLRAYEAAVTSAELRSEEIHANANGMPASVELWVHVPEGTANIDEKWKENKNGLLLVRSKWEWPGTGGKPTRWTWDPEGESYAENGKAAGLDTVFNSRLPVPFRIGALEDPAKEHVKLLELVLEPIKTRLSELMKDDASELRAKVKTLQEEAEKPVEEFRDTLAVIQSKVNNSYQSVFNSSQVRLRVSLGDLPFDPATALTKASAIDVVEPHGQTRWSQQGTGSQRALFWSMLEVRSELNRISQQQKQRERAIKDAEKEIGKQEQKLLTLKKEDAKKRCEDEIKRLQDELLSLRRLRRTMPHPRMRFCPVTCCL